MKKIIFLLIGIMSLFSINSSFAQKRIQIQNGVYLVSYGNTAVIEDEINQCSISIEVSQVAIDRKTNERIYEVVCGRWTRRVVKDGLKGAIDAGITATGATKGVSLTVSALAKAVGYIYDDVCDSFEE